MREFTKEMLKGCGFVKEVEEVERGACPFCRQTIKQEDFRDEISWKEFSISGLCQKCQDEFFKEEEE